MPALLEGIPLNLRTNLWFMHDGSPVPVFIWGQTNCHEKSERKEITLEIIIDHFFRARQNFANRCQKCIEQNGGHFENLL